MTTLPGCSSHDLDDDGGALQCLASLKGGDPLSG
jgi:hypothetical protein